MSRGRKGLHEQLTRGDRIDGDAGLTLIEVLMASLVASVGLVGGVALLCWAEQGRQVGTLGTRALAGATSIVEAKRAVVWERLLVDVSDDGQSERAMADDGRPPDATAGDGIYTAEREADGIRLTWTVEPSRRGVLADSGHVTIRVQASYRTVSGRSRLIEVSTLRANPKFIGPS